MNSYMRNGDTYFVSYRDPNLKKTDEIYDGIPQYLADFKADEREMTNTSLVRSVIWIRR